MDSALSKHWKESFSVTMIILREKILQKDEEESENCWGRMKGEEREDPTAQSRV